jgi:hypothetical protein
MRASLRACLHCLLVVFGLVYGGSAANAAVLQVSGGILTGATEVDVGGVLYDVTFVEGTCATVYNGCDQASDFTFASYADAELAAQALLQYVLIDSGAGFFDALPSKSYGCGSDTVPCTFYIASAETLVTGYVEGGAALNFPGTLTDIVSAVSGMSKVCDTATTLCNVSSVYTVWSRSNSVPEPASLALVALGLLCMLGGARARRNA